MLRTFAIFALTLGGSFSSLGYLGAIASRFFQSPSTWYYKIPSGQTLHPNSAGHVNYLLAKTGGPALSLSSAGWSVPIYYTNSSVPNTTVSITGGAVAKAAILAGGWNVVPIPQGAKPASGDGSWDCHMVVIDEARRLAWDFVAYNPSAKSAYHVKRWNLAGNGIDQPYTMAAGRVAPVPLLQGLITHAEMQRGYIDHALAFAGPTARRNSPGVYPCVTSNNGESDDPNALQLGMRLQLDPSVDVNSLNLSPGGKIIARALQEYGAIFIENNGPGYSSFYAEDREYLGGWGSLLGGVSGIPMNKLRIVQPVMSGSTAPPTPLPLPPPGNVQVATSPVVTTGPVAIGPAPTSEGNAMPLPPDLDLIGIRMDTILAPINNTLDRLCECIQSYAQQPGVQPCETFPFNFSGSVVQTAVCHVLTFAMQVPKGQTGVITRVALQERYPGTLYGANFMLGVNDSLAPEFPRIDNPIGQGLQDGIGTRICLEEQDLVWFLLQCSWTPAVFVGQESTYQQTLFPWQISGYFQYKEV